MNNHYQLVKLMLGLNLIGQVYTEGIIGGHEAAPHSHPYMVLLDRTKENGVKSRCGGFLLNENFVLTAAHCKARSYKVLLAVHNANDKNVQRLDVAKEFPHQDFNIDDYEHDIMLLKLSSNATFNSDVKAIALANQNDIPPKSCTVSGWGRYDNTLRLSDVLKEVHVTLTDKEPCVNEYFYCSQAKEGPAEGDSGGPLVCEDGKAYGVASVYMQKEGVPYTRFYVNIPRHRQWIDFIVQNN